MEADLSRVQTIRPGVAQAANVGEFRLLQRPARSPTSPSAAPPIASTSRTPEDEPLGDIAPLSAPQNAAAGAASKQADLASHFDPIIVDAFGRSAKDKAMLMRADTEMEHFARDPSLHKLPIQPPHFAPINSFQRLLIHRLADMYGLERVLEPMLIPGPSGGPISVLVLQKTANTRLPAARLADLDRYLLGLAMAQPKIIETPRAPPDAYQEPSRSPRAELELLAPVAAPPPPANFRIMTRQPGAETVRSHSAASGDESSQAKRALTLEEREAAYLEARQRIFASGFEETTDRLDGLTTASCPETPLMRPKALRPSAPSFDPITYAPVASTSRLPLTDLDSEVGPPQSSNGSAPHSPMSRGHRRSGSRSPSSASVSTIASSKTSTSTSSSVSDSVSRTSRSNSARRSISASQPVMRFGPGPSAPPLFPPHHPQRPASPSPSTASVSTTSSRRSGGSKSHKLGMGLPDLEPMAGRNAHKSRRSRTRTPSPPPAQPLHPSLPSKPLWSDKQKGPESPPQQVISPPPVVSSAPPMPVQPMPPDPRFYQPEYYAASYPQPVPTYYAAPPAQFVPAGYYAIPEGQVVPQLFDPYMMQAAAIYQQNLESLMGQMRLAPQNGDVPVIQLDEDSPRAARPPSMALFDPNEAGGIRRNGSVGRGRGA